MDKAEYIFEKVAAVPGMASAKNLINKAIKAAKEVPQNAHELKTLLKLRPYTKKHTPELLRKADRQILHVAKKLAIGASAPTAAAVGTAAAAGLGAKALMKKEAFFALTPFKSKPADEYHSVKGYLPESGNRVVSSLAGGLTGAVAGAGLGGALGALTRKPGAIRFSASMGTVLGGAVGNIRSLRKSEEEAGVRKSTAGQILGRFPAMLLGPVGDYIVSRKLQKHPAVLPSNGDK